MLIYLVWIKCLVCCIMDIYRIINKIFSEMMNEMGNGDWGLFIYLGKWVDLNFREDFMLIVGWR